MEGATHPLRKAQRVGHPRRVLGRYWVARRRDRRFRGRRGERREERDKAEAQRLAKKRWVEVVEWEWKERPTLCEKRKEWGTQEGSWGDTGWQDAGIEERFLTAGTAFGMTEDLEAGFSTFGSVLLVQDS